MNDQTAPIGHNEPPACEAFAMAINDYYAEAKNHLDGKPIENQKQADDLTAILDIMKELLRDAEKSRKSEKQPFLDAGKEVDTRWKAVQEPAKLTITEATKPLTVWRVAVQAEKDAEAKRLREEADKAERDAHSQREQAAGLSEVHEAETLLEQAKIAKLMANKIDRGATGLRTTYKAEITDPIAFGKWAWESRRDDYMAFLETLASQNIEAAKAGTLPGVGAELIKKAS